MCKQTNTIRFQQLINNTHKFYSNLMKTLKKCSRKCQVINTNITLKVYLYFSRKFSTIIGTARILKILHYFMAGLTYFQSLKYSIFENVEYFTF